VGLPKDYRLRSRQDFQNVYKKGRRWKGKYLMVRCLIQSPIIKISSEETLKQGEKRAKQPYVTKFGISVSQKVSKKAVIRNRLKRQVRAALRELFPRITPGWLVVISLNPNASCWNYNDCLREIEHLLAEATVLADASQIKTIF
jgi:ribonuclease P protein component